MLKQQVFVLTIVLLALAGLSACGQESGALPSGGGGDDGTPTEPQETLDERLTRVITSLGLSGDAASGSGLLQVVPNQFGSPTAKLGQLLFFSRTLSGDLDVACASCHMPHLGGGDGLSLPVGVAAIEPGLLGLGREINPDLDQDPKKDGGPNVPRNSQTIFNVALYSRALFHDGRAFVMDELTVPGGNGQNIRTPDSGNVADPDAGGNLLEAQARFPLVSHQEMRNFRYPELSDPEAYRQLLVGRLRGEVEAEKLAEGGALAWLAHFCAAFCSETGLDAAPEVLITMPHIQRALSAYQASQIFTYTAWRQYVQGNVAAISDSAKRGAALFLSEAEDGGLGCVSCHSGDRFTDERFYNLGFPQIGRGKRADSTDPGRWLVTQEDSARYAFRTPGLINVAVTGPYGHAGTFSSLESLLAYHADPRGQVGDFFGTAQLLFLPQFQGIDIAALYPEAESYTRAAIAAESFLLSEARLPARPLSAGEITDLKSFLLTLTDQCVASIDCISQWIPDPSEDPDGNMLIAGATVVPDGTESDPYPASIALNFPPVTARTTFPELEAACTGINGLTTAVNENRNAFVQRGIAAEDDFGLNDAHGWASSTWFSETRGSYEMSMFAGGISAVYPEGSCWPGLLFAGGDVSGVVLYRSLGGQLGFQRDDTAFADMPPSRTTGVAVADLDGNYRRELLLGNHMTSELPIMSPAEDGRYRNIAMLPMGRGTFGISFGDIDLDGYPDFYLGHWALGGVPGSAPALWRNDAGSQLLPFDGPGKTSSAYVDQNFNFTPIFADMTGSGRQDLLIVSDFMTTQALRNVPSADGAAFEQETDRDVLTDENGMGGVVADFFNSGRLDWFVGAIFDPSGDPRGNWGSSGNRFYRNDSDGEALRFTDITAAVGQDMRDSGWSWGMCAADFNNDGFLDVFNVNGFGYIPDDVIENETQADIRDRFAYMTEGFREQPPKLFINQADGTFVEQASVWGLVQASEGIGVTCLDYDRDGDIDMVLVDQSDTPQFFENQTGHGSGSRFLSVRLVGAAPNTEALGARVMVSADVGNGRGVQVMQRASQANSNFNSQNLPDLHFGVGHASVISELTVVWPGGDELVCQDIPVNQFLVIDQRDGGTACP